MNFVLHIRGLPTVKKPAYKLTDLWRNIYHELRSMQFDGWTCLEERRAIRTLCRDMNNKELVVQLPLRAEMLQQAEALLNKKIDAYAEDEEEDAVDTEGDGTWPCATL